MNVVSEPKLVLTLALFFVLIPFTLAVVQRQWSAATAEDEAFGMVRDEIGGCVEIVGLDTRLLRPWGDSAACERFIMSARGHGHGWLEAVVAPLHVEAPIALRAVAGEIEGVKVAFLLARTRRMGTVAKALALGPGGLVEEIEELGPHEVRPLLALRVQLERLARRAQESATKK